jgi:hypothetical protein
VRQSECILCWRRWGGKFCPRTRFPAGPAAWKGGLRPRLAAPHGESYCLRSRTHYTSTSSRRTSAPSECRRSAQIVRAGQHVGNRALRGLVRPSEAPSGNATYPELIGSPRGRGRERVIEDGSLGAEIPRATSPRCTRHSPRGPDNRRRDALRLLGSSERRHRACASGKSFLHD